MTLHWILLSTKNNMLIKFSKNLLSLTAWQKNRKLLKPAGSRPGVVYSLCNVHNASIENCPPFRPILSALNTPTYKPDLNNFEFKELLSLGTRDPHFIFDGILYKQIDGVAMGSLLGLRFT